MNAMNTVNLDSSKDIPLLEARGLAVHYPAQGGVVRAVDGVDFSVFPRECIGLVGESGCGKTTVGNAVIGLVPLQGGTLQFEGRKAPPEDRAALMAYRRRVQMVFQDPFGSLNPRMSIGRAIGEVLRIHHINRQGDSIEERVAGLLQSVGLEADFVNRYPHEFSGGQRQRIGIARALAVDPVLLVADEPVSALDVSVQVQILNLLRDLQAQRNLTLLFVAHDLAVVRYMCSRVYVMYLGRIMECGPVESLYRSPSHPYTEALLSAVPDVGRGLEDRRSGKNRRILLKGDVPSAARVIPGCRFHTRCHRVQAICRHTEPAWRLVGPGRGCACHFALPAG